MNVINLGLTVNLDNVTNSHLFRGLSISRRVVVELESSMAMAALEKFSSHLAFENLDQTVMGAYERRGVKCPPA